MDTEMDEEGLIAFGSNVTAKRENVTPLHAADKLDKAEIAAFKITGEVDGRLSWMGIA